MVLNSLFKINFKIYEMWHKLEQENVRIFLVSIFMGVQ